MFGRRAGLITRAGGSSAPAMISDPDEVLSIDEFVDGDVVGRSGSQLTTFTAAELAALVEPELSLPAAGSDWSSRPSYLGAASAIDDEFDGNSSANYTFSPTVSGSAIAPYTTTATNPRVSWAGVRSSCLTIQPPDNVHAYMSRAHTPPSDGWWWVRAVVNPSQSTPTATNQTLLALYLATDGTVSNHFVGVALGPQLASGTAYSAMAYRNHTAGSAQIGGVLWAAGSVARHTQIWIQKNSGTYHFYSASDSLDWYYHGSIAYSGNTLDTLVFDCFNDGGLPGTNLINIDFIRHGTTADTILP
jgi:hypothetical protein